MNRYISYQLFYFHFISPFILGIEKELFASCNGPEKNRVGRSVKKYF